MADHARNLYVEIDVRASIERLWHLTQTPELHQRWDLRFTNIEYLPREDQNEPQRFLYATRIGFGVAITGEGETVGSHEKEGQRSSALKFWSSDSKSLIREGSGYWRYSPREDGVRFVTGYDYDVRFGFVGRTFDRIVFRPLIGWATAWSFDRLRLWLEQDVPPEFAMRQSLVHFLARVTVAFIWLWHGIVPKLVYKHADELAPLIAAGFSARSARLQLITGGWAEVAIGLVLLLAWRARWPLWLTLVAMPIALVSVTIYAPSLLKAAFNPVSLNAAMFILATIALLTGRNLPSARRCRRKPGARMSSIYQIALGSDFAKLHPHIQRRFGFSSADRTAAIGRGVMERIWHGRMYTLPFLYVGTWRRIMFPEYGQNIPFTIENYAYVDSLGRETVTWLRTFQTRRPRRFDAYMIYSLQRRKIVDYLGTHQHLAVDIDLSVDERGGLRLRSGKQRFYERYLGFRFPMFFSGIADVCEWYDETLGQYRIEVNVHNRRWGPLFGYSGYFDVEWLSIAPEHVPAHAKPRREERRE